MKSKYHISIYGVVLLFALPVIASAQKYLVGIPGIDSADLNFGDYINALYAFAISIAALLAVIKIIIAGMKYMLSGVVTSKQEAISDIQGAVFGLLIVVLAYSILYFINPRLTETTIEIQEANPPAPPGAAIPPGEIVTGDGGKYFYARRTSDTAFIASFKAKCAEENGYYTIGGDNIVCYLPLSGTETAFINSLYGASYTNIALVRSRFQKSHSLRRITDGGKLAEIEAAKGAENVLVAVTLTPANDWIDQANRLYMDQTCEELRRVHGKATRVVYGSNYVGCVY